MASTVTVFDQKGSQVIPNLTATIMMSEVHTANNEIASQVLENGSPMVDHIIIQPDEVDLSFIVTNIDGVRSPLEGENAKTAWQELKRMRNNRELLTIMTRHEIYENMAIETMTATHEAPYKGQMKYDIKLKKVDLTNFNTGKNTKSKFTNSSSKSVINSSAVEVNKKYPIAASATDVVNRGLLDVIIAKTMPGLADTVAGQWLNQNFSADTIYSISKDPSAVLTRSEEELQTAKTGLLDSMSFIDISGDTPTAVDTLINESYVTFETKYNYQNENWTIDIGNLLTGIIISGITMSPGVNLLEGYNLDLPIENLYVVDIAENGSSTVEAWGKGIVENTSIKSVLIYFSDAALAAFITAVNNLNGTRDLNFSLNDLDYEVSA